MTPHDQARFAKLISGFVDGCKSERPFHLVVIDARGQCSVFVYRSNGDIEQVCSGPAKANRLRMISPLTVTAISGDDCGKSAKIEITTARPTMQ